jgi:hypothetical protein
MSVEPPVGKSVRKVIAAEEIRGTPQAVKKMEGPPERGEPSIFFWPFGILSFTYSHPLFTIVQLL